MHIPEGFLSPEAALVGTAVGAAGVGYCLRRANREVRERDLPIAGLAAAFFLVGDAPLFPLAVGTQGHLLGGTLAVALLGPWLGALTITVVCVIQALALGDGGITTLGLTVVNMALLPAAVACPLIVVLRRAVPFPIACGMAAAVTVLLAAGLFVAEFALGAARAVDLGTIAATTMGAYAVVAVVEALLTVLIVRALLGVRPGMLRLAGAPA